MKWFKMTKSELPSYKRKGFLAIILIALGVVMNTSLGTTPSTIGTIMIALGGFFLFVALKEKRDNEEKK